jgi:hypothetical protein
MKRGPTSACSRPGHRTRTSAGDTCTVSAAVLNKAVAKTMMEKALQNLIQLLKTDVPSWHYGCEQLFWRSCFEVIQQMPGSNKKFNEIAGENDIEQLQDKLAEVKYAVVFSELGFRVEMEPLASRGTGPNPDLRISRDGHSSIVEVKRRRLSDSGPKPLANGADIMPEYGDERDWRRIFEDIERKFRQAGTKGIIAIWNNDARFDPFEVKIAVRVHLLQPHANRSSFVLFRSDVVENFYCFKLRHHLAPYQARWINELRCVAPKEVLFSPYLRKYGA